MIDSAAQLSIAPLVSPALPEAPPAPAAAPAAKREAAQIRLAALVRQHYDLIWRSLRRLGVREADVDDAAQRVLGVVARKLEVIEPRAEKSFVFQTALRVASDMRRAHARVRATPDEDALARAHDARPNPEEALHRKEARACLDDILDGLSMDLRAVFVLFELEEMSTSEIAATLGIPAGTVSSRLSRARDEFQALAAKARTARTDRRRP